MWTKCTHSNFIGAVRFFFVFFFISHEFPRSHVIRRGATWDAVAKTVSVPWGFSLYLNKQAPRRAIHTVLTAPRRSCKMVFQLRVHSPTGVEKIIDLCDNEEQMKKTTVLQLKQIIKKTFMTGMYIGRSLSSLMRFLLVQVAYLIFFDIKKNKCRWC